MLSIPNKQVHMIKRCNGNKLCAICFLREISEKFDIGCGLRRGDAFSHALFNKAIEKAKIYMEKIRVLKLFTDTILLSYTDDIVMLR